VPSLLINLHFGPIYLATFYTLLFFGGLQPLCGIGVTSFISVILYPRLFKALTADSLPGPGPFTKTTKLLRPYSFADAPAFSAAT